VPGCFSLEVTAIGFKVVAPPTIDFGEFVAKSERLAISLGFSRRSAAYQACEYAAVQVVADDERGGEACASPAAGDACCNAGMPVARPLLSEAARRAAVELCDVGDEGSPWPRRVVWADLAAGDACSNELSDYGIEEIIDSKRFEVPSPRVIEESVDVAKVISQECFQQCVVEQEVDMLMPQAADDTVQRLIDEALRLGKDECAEAAQLFDNPSPRVSDGTVEVALIMPHESFQQRVEEQNMDMLVPQAVGDIVQQLIDEPSPRAIDETVEFEEVIPQESFQQRVVEQKVVPQAFEEIPERVVNKGKKGEAEEKKNAPQGGCGRECDATQLCEIPDLSQELRGFEEYMNSMRPSIGDLEAILHMLEVSETNEVGKVRMNIIKGKLSELTGSHQAVEHPAYSKHVQSIP